MTQAHHSPDTHERQPARPHADPSLSLPLLWPVLAAASATGATASFFSGIANAIAEGGEHRPEREWTTPNTVSLELPTMRLRDFSAGAPGPATLVCAPYALHGATIVDFAPGHSVVEALQGAGLERLFVADWRSATPQMRYFSIDSYLADLNVAVDALAPPVDLIGLCQGGWLALVYAARFPGKVRRLVIAGAPIDVHAGNSQLSLLATATPLSVFDDLVRFGGGIVQGHRVLDFWAPVFGAEQIASVLQLPADIAPQAARGIEQQFRDWYAWTLDLPGTYYLQVVKALFKENQIAEGRFVALGRTINLADVRVPLFLLAAESDELTNPEQLLAAVRLVGTPQDAITTRVEPTSHLGLFMGKRTLARVWPKIARWLAEPLHS